MSKQTQKARDCHPLPPPSFVSSSCSFFRAKPAEQKRGKRVEKEIKMNHGQISTPFMDVVRATRYEDLLDLAQKQVPPMCVSEVATSGSLNTFLQAVKQIHNPIVSLLNSIFSAPPPHDLTDQQVSDVDFLQKLICIIGHVTRVVPFKRPYGEYTPLVFKELLVPILQIRDTQWTNLIAKLKREGTHFTL
jgi:hypothetical protein